MVVPAVVVGVVPVGHPLPDVADHVAQSVTRWADTCRSGVFRASASPDDVGADTSSAAGSKSLPQGYRCPSAPPRAAFFPFGFRRQPDDPSRDFGRPRAVSHGIVVAERARPDDWRGPPAAVRPARHTARRDRGTRVSSPPDAMSRQLRRSTAVDGPVARMNFAYSSLVTGNRPMKNSPTRHAVNRTLVGIGVGRAHEEIAGGNSGEVRVRLQASSCVRTRLSSESGSHAFHRKASIVQWMTSPLNRYHRPRPDPRALGPVLHDAARPTWARASSRSSSRAAATTRGTWGPPFLGTESALFPQHQPQQGERDARLQAPEGRAILDRLIAKSDVIVENFRPGTLGAARPRLRVARAGASAPHLLFGVGLRTDRAAPQGSRDTTRCCRRKAA